MPPSISAGTAALIAAGVGAAATTASTIMTMNAGSKAPTPPPPPPAPTPMPTMNSTAVQNAQQQEIAQTEAASGRASTIMSSPTGTSDKLG